MLLALLLACPPKTPVPEAAGSSVETEPSEATVQPGWEGFPEPATLDDLVTVQSDPEAMRAFVGTTWYLIDLDPDNPVDLTMTFYEDGSFELHGWGYEGMEWAATEDTLVFWVNNRYSHHAAVATTDGSLVGVGRQRDGYSWRFRMVEMGPVKAETVEVVPPPTE